MTQIAQEVEEEWVARLLFSILGIGPIRALRRGNPAPDLVADFDDQQIALEVTEIFVPSDGARVPYQAVENYRQQLLETCEVDWHRHGNPAVEVHVHFNPSATILKNQIGALAAQLCKAIVTHLPSADGYAELEFDWDRRDSFLPERVAAIQVLRLPAGYESHWLGADAALSAHSHERWCRTESIESGVATTAKARPRRGCSSSLMAVESPEHSPFRKASPSTDIRHSSIACSCLNCSRSAHSNSA